MILYKYILCPISQKVFFLLNHFNISTQVIYINNNNDFKNIKEIIGISPLPVLVEDNIYLKGPLISDYINMKYKDYQKTMEERFLENLLDGGFYYEVYKNIVYEKTFKYLESSNITPNTMNIHQGMKYLKKYLIFFEEYLQKNKINNFFYFKISLFFHLMCLDYCGDINWNQYEEIKKFYIRMKYNTFIREILKERINNLSPPVYYEMINF
ncbi:hypothetical protein AB836_01625 [Rickettsiales bacterium (ex Bugula neritina AB1)]|nr:hypothetical protein AB836_01625 [Rickettsiales bacterium (ex Bugula neritina AB1)]